MQKNMILPCILSGLFGVVFTLACGANADTGSNTDGLTKTIYEGECPNPLDTTMLPTLSGNGSVSLLLTDPDGNWYYPPMGSSDLPVYCTTHTTSWRIVVIE